MYEINLCCPCCGNYTWEISKNTCICSECGSKHTPEEMEIHFFNAN